MHILLVEPDYYTRYPPLGLLKLSTYHKLKGDTVELVRGEKIPKKKPNKIYVTSLFTYAWEPVHEAVRFYKIRYPKVKIILGGIYASLMPEHAKTSGAHEIYQGLFKKAEDLRPDYDLIPEWDGSIIFASRGCVRRCSYCAVPKLEGKPHALKYSIKHLIEPSHNKVILWDNNLLGNKNWRDIFDELIGLKLKVDFNQGLDARLVTEEVAEKISKLNIDVIRLAYDYPAMGQSVKKAIDLLTNVGISGRRIIVYTLYNHKDSPNDFFKRVQDLLRWGVVSYPMRFEPLNSENKNSHVSPRWTEEKLQMIASARRVIGYAGSFPPYDGLVKKITKAQNFREAFSLYPIGWREKKKQNTLDVYNKISEGPSKWGGHNDWRVDLIEKNGKQKPQSLKKIIETN